LKKESGILEGGILLVAIKIRIISTKIARKEVLGYFERYSEAFPSDAANALGLDLETVHKIARELIAEKRLEVSN